MISLFQLLLVQALDIEFLEIENLLGCNPGWRVSSVANCMVLGPTVSGFPGRLVFPQH